MCRRLSGKDVQECKEKIPNVVSFVNIQRSLVRTTTFVPKDVAFKTNLLLYKILNGQNDM